MSLSHLLFIPVYNCEQQIPRVINKILESSIYEKFDEILIIDNNSVDNTADIVLKKINSENCKNSNFFKIKKIIILVEHIKQDLIMQLRTNLIM